MSSVTVVRRKSGPRKRAAPKVSKKPINDAYSENGVIPKGIVHADTLFRTTRSGTFPWITTSTSAEVVGAWAFTLTSASDYASFAAVFDQYMIEMAEVWIEPRTLAGGLANTGRFVTAIDFDDQNAPAGTSELLDYNNACVTTGGLGRYMRFVPHVAPALYNGAFTSFGNESNKWIDSASATVQHFGVKIASTATTSAFVYDMRYRLHFAFRNSR